MLISFAVENFKSIKEQRTVSLLMSNLKDGHVENVFSIPTLPKISLLKSAIVYGPNASGKSNVINAMSTFKKMLLNSSKLAVDEKIPVYYPYKLDEEWVRRPTYFKIEFVFEGVKHDYSFSYNDAEIVSEELVYYPSAKSALLFARERGADLRFGVHLRGSKLTIAKDLLPNNLFLSKAANVNHEQLLPVYRYLRDSIVVYDNNERMLKLKSKTTVDMIYEDELFKKKVVDLLVSADTGISDVDIVEDKAGSFAFPPEIPERIKEGFLRELGRRPIAIHKKFKSGTESGFANFDLYDEESSGTVKLFRMASSLVRALESGAALWVDELDNSFHTYISMFVVRMFHDERVNPRNAQIVFSTHDTALLSSDLFRRDQVWFTEKDRFGATDVYSLAEFDSSSVRKTANFKEWYLDGRFGAVPNVVDFLKPSC